MHCTVNECLSCREHYCSPRHDAQTLVSRLERCTLCAAQSRLPHAHIAKHTQMLLNLYCTDAHRRVLKETVDVLK